MTPAPESLPTVNAAQSPANAELLSTPDAGQGDEDKDAALPEVESKFAGTCLAIPYIPSADDIPEGAGGAVLVQEDQLWDNGTTITYGFYPKISKLPEYGEGKVDEIVKEWSLYANITFERVKNVEDAIVRIRFDRGDGSWSLTGRRLIEDRPADKPTMNLGGVYNINKTPPSDIGTILHEFGHVLGLRHEHQNPLRKDAFRMNEQYTIEAYQKTHKWSAELVKEQILDVFNSKDVGNYTDLDLNSVMMYFMPAAQNDKGIEIKPINELSDYDKAFMLIHYPYFGFEPRVKGWDFEKALDVFGIQGEDREVMMELYGAGNVRDVRSHFGKVYESIREQRNAALVEDIAAGRLTAPVEEE